MSGPLPPDMPAELRTAKHLLVKGEANLTEAVKLEIEVTSLRPGAKHDAKETEATEKGLLGAVQLVIAGVSALVSIADSIEYLAQAKSGERFLDGGK